MSLLTDVVMVKSSSHDLRSMPFWLFMVAGIGWINPLTLLYLLLSLSTRFTRLRFACALAILLCLAATFVFFAVAPFVPLIGYFIWLIGILMMIVPGLPRGFNVRAPVE